MLKVMSISPYKNLQLQFEKVHAEHGNIYFENFVGDLEKGVKIALEKEKQFDLIISRGGTAQEIRKVSSLPVIEVEISILDILRIIKLVDGYNQKYTFIGFSNITRQVKILSEILNKNIDIVTIKSRKDLDYLIESLKREGYSLVIGDYVTYKTAHAKRLNSILIESGIESVETAINNALEIGNNLQKLRVKSEVLQEVQGKLSFSILIFNKKKNLIYSGDTNDKIINLAKSILSRKKLPKNEKIIFYEHYYGIIYTVAAINDNNGYYFTITKSGPVPTFGILFEPVVGREKINKNSALLVGDTIDILKKNLKNKNNIVVIGENGTGKESIKEIIPSLEKKRKIWMLHMDAKVSDNMWFNFFESIDSPIYEYSAIFLVDGITEKNIERLNDLLYYIRKHNLDSQWIFFMRKNTTIIDTINSIENVYQLELKEVRNRKSELSAIISLYIYEINKKLGTSVLGFDIDAMDEMINYDWPGNFRQLKKVIRILVSKTRSVFISLNAVKEQLRLEQSLYTKNYDEDINLFKGKTLSEIQKLIIQEKLKENNGNRSKTAEQLGISRSKIWRMLK